MYIDDLTRLRHMLDSAREAVDFVGGRTQAELAADRIRLLAVVRAVEVVGEAASQVSTEFRQRHPDLAWRGAIALRNRLIHGYFDVNPEIIWSTVTQDLPPLIIQLEQILAGVRPPDPEVE